MIIKKTDIYGNQYYADAFSGKKVRLMRVTGKHRGKIPNGVFGRFIIPQIRGDNKVSNIIK